MRNFLIERVEFAKSLYKESDQATYHDIVLILTAVLSACASKTYAGDHIDRVRFIELLIKHSKASHKTSNISIPYLINDGHIDNSNTEWSKPGYANRILMDTEVDISLDEAHEMYPDLDILTLKKYSYAFFIYKFLRCGYAHSYYRDGSLTHVAPSRRSTDTRISYIGRINDQGHIVRSGCFHIEYLIDLAEYHAQNLKQEHLAHPNEWWIKT